MARSEPLNIEVSVTVNGDAVITSGHARMRAKLTSDDMRHDAFLADEAQEYLEYGLLQADAIRSDSSATTKNSRPIEQFPHCDSRVLHTPGECEYCDERPEWQALRDAWNISFTGKYEKGKELCPADKARGIGAAHKWHGNAPTTTKESQKYWTKMWSEVRALQEKGWDVSSSCDNTSCPCWRGGVCNWWKNT